MRLPQSPLFYHHTTLVCSQKKNNFQIWKFLLWKFRTFIKVSCIHGSVSKFLNFCTFVALICYRPLSPVKWVNHSNSSFLLPQLPQESVRRAKSTQTKLYVRKNFRRTKLFLEHNVRHKISSRFVYLTLFCSGLCCVYSSLSVIIINTVDARYVD